jgi:4-hydroxybenzoyl-CoA thioesterase
MTFSRDIKIRFQHCDPAGIVFYPRYFEMFNQMVEDWFAEDVGMSFQTMHLEHQLGVPLVHAEADFMRASRIGEVLVFSLRVEEIRRRSFRLAIEATHDGEARVKANLTLACVSLGETLHSTEVPDSLRTAMEPFLKDEG